MVVQIKVSGTKQALKTVNGISCSFSGMDIREFGKAMASKARELLEKSRKGWKNPLNKQHITFNVEELTRKRVRMYATSIGKDGYDYTNVQELGYRGIRTPRNKPYMVFRGKQMNRGWRKVKEVGPIPAKHYMRDTAKWSRDRFKKYMRARVKRIVKSKGKDQGYGLTLTRGG